MVKQSLRWRLLEFSTLGIILLSYICSPANNLATKLLIGQTKAYAADWASPRFDVAQTGYNRDGIALMPLNISWQRGAFYIYDEGRTRPLVVGDKVLLGVNDWYHGVTSIYALSVYGGSTIWQYDPSDKSISDLVSANGKVYFSAQNPATSAAKLYALDLATGSLTWTLDIGATRPGRPVVDGQDLYVVNSDGLYVIDAVNGIIKRTVPLPGSYSTTSRAAVSQGLVFVNYGNGVCAIDSQSGQIKWTYSVLYGPISAPAVGNNTVYVSGDYKLTALDVTTGSIKWQAAVSGRHAGIDADRWEPTVTDNMVFIGAIEAYDANTGTLKWSYETLYRNKFYTNEENATSAAVLGGYVFVGTTRWATTFSDTSDGRLYVFKASTGELAYLYERGVYYNSWTADPSTAVGNNRVAVNFATNNLTLFTFNSTKGISGFKGVDYISALEPLDCHDDSFIADPVNTSTGGQEINRTLLTLNGAQPLSFKVRYNTLLLNEGLLGKGWEHDFETSLEETQSGNVIIHWSANRKNIFVSNGNGQHSGQDLAVIHDTLIKNQDGSYTLTRKDQSKYLFSAEGKLTQQKNSHGQLLNMNYDANGRLIKVEEPISGRSINISHNEAGLINQVTDSSNRHVTFGYDANHNLTSITDAKGQTTIYTYNSASQVLTATDAEGVVLFSNTYDSEGRIVAQDDAVASNQLTTFSYDEFTEPGELITTVTDRNGKTRVLTHDYKYELISIKDELQNTIETYTYDTSGNRTSAKDANGNLTKLTYDSSGNLLTITDAKGNTSKMTYDERNNLLSLENAMGKKILYTYDANNNLTSATDQLGDSTTYDYDSNSLLQTKVTPRQGLVSYTYEGGLPHTVTNAVGNTSTLNYDAAGRLIGIIDAAGKETTMTYDEVDNLISVKDPLGNIKSFTYNSHNDKLSETDARGNTTYYTYNGNGKLISRVDALNNETHYEYDGEDRFVKTIDARGDATTFTYDDKGRLTGTTDPLGHTSTIQYDALDNIIGKTDALGNKILTITYDALNNPVTLKDALGNTTTKHYDSLNRIDSITDPLTHVTQYSYDDLNRMSSTTDALNGVSNQDFDADGNRISLQDPNGNKTNFNFDKSGRLIAKTSPTGDITRYSYDSRDLLSEVENGRFQITDYQYDDAGRLTTLISPEDTTTYTYDPNGNILTVTDSTGTITREYDALNRITKYIDAQGNTIQYSYDAVGNLTTLTYPGGKQVTYGYDAANRLVSVTDWARRVTTYEYNANGRLVKATRPNGTVLTRTYNEASQLILQKDTDRNGNIISQCNYGYDAAGNVTLEQNASDEETFTLPNTSMAYGSDNRLATFNGQPVFYDEDGNMTTGPLSGSMANYTYDSRNRLTSAGNLSYLYNAENNRVGVVDNGKTTRYTINTNAKLSQVLIKTDDQGNKTFYIYGLGLIGQEEADGTYKTYHFDRRGSTIAITDENGNVTDRFQYAPYGELARHDGLTNTPFMFNGGYGVMTDSNGLYYMRARYYNPEIRRFINQDVLTGSIDNGQSLNRYAYTNGNPISYVDPFGLWGIGLSGSESTEIGVVFDDGKIGLGAGQTGSYGGGFFSHGFFENSGIGSFKTWGGYVGGPGYGVGYPSGADKDNKDGGAYVGIGLNAFITNADSAADLNGPAKTFSINIGWADRVFALQVARGDNGIWMISYGGIPLPGAGFGFSVSDYYTYTEARK